MNDSFFTSRNTFDEQLVRQNFTADSCELLIEACTRRVTVLSGPNVAAVRLQRLADICAGVHVLPIDHWRDVKPPAPAASPAPTPSRFERAWALIVGNPGVVFWSGFFLGVYIGGRT